MLNNPFIHPLWGRSVLIIAMICSFFYNIHGVPLFDLDEGAFSEATREMIASGNYLSTYLNGEHRWDKPIFIYWFMALSGKLFGLSEWSMRLPSAIFSIGWAGVIFFFSRRLWGESVAFWATFMMITALQITIIAKAAIADALLNFCLAGAGLSIFLYYRERTKFALYSTFVFMGLGLLTKGPIAIAVPFIASFLFFSLKKELAVWLKAVINPIGIMILLLIALPWYIAEYLVEGQAFIDGFFLKHNVNRFSSSLEGHSGSPLYYIPVLIIGFLPFSSYLIRSFSRLKLIINDDFGLFGLLWFGFVFIFFSLGGTKLPHYVIYGYTPLFIIIARFGMVGNRFALFAPVWLLMGVLLALPLIATEIEPVVKDLLARTILHETQHYFDTSYYLFFGLIVCIITFLTLDKRYSNEAKMVLVAFISVIAINGIIMPIYGKVAQQPIKNAALFAKNHGYTVVMWNLNMPTFVFYSEKFVQKRDPLEGDIVITKITNLSRIEAYTPLYQEGAFALVQITKLKP